MKVLYQQRISFTPILFPLQVNTSQEALCRLYFLHSVLAPLIEGYWLSACNLIRLQDVDLPEAQFSQIVNAYSKDRVAKGLAIYGKEHTKQGFIILVFRVQLDLGYPTISYPDISIVQPRSCSVYCLF